MKSLRIAARTFLLSFVPLCVTLVASFYAINAAVKRRVEDHLKASIQRNEFTMRDVSANADRRNRQLVTILGENPALKAGLGLLHEIAPNSARWPQARRTIEDNLLELSASAQYDLLIVCDASGRVVAAVNGGEPAFQHLSTVSPNLPIIEAGGVLYSATTVPINLADENLGSLTVGRRFDVRSYKQLGEVMLLKDGRAVASTLSPALSSQLAPELEARCTSRTDGCEILAGGETYLALPLQNAGFGEDFASFSMRPVGPARKELIGDISGIFWWIGAVGVLTAGVAAFAASRSVSQPITALIGRLKESEQTGRLPADFPVRSALAEVNLLGEAFNRAAGALQESQEKLDRAYLQFIETMVEALDARDPYTAGHSTRVSRYSAAIATALALPPDEIETIRVGALLHDIGKIGVPDSVLQKAGRLTEEEFALIRLHPQIGRRILEKVGRFEQYLSIVELHHEDVDGNGYPYGLRAENIPLVARIVRVADAYDAMTTDRAYRRALPLDRVRVVMRQAAGSQFDPQIVDTLLQLCGHANQMLAQEAEYAQV